MNCLIGPTYTDDKGKEGTSAFGATPGGPHS